MAMDEDWPDRAWNLAEMERQLRRFDAESLQIRELKIFYLEQKLECMDRIEDLGADDPERGKKLKVLLKKIDDINAAYSAIRGL